MEEPGILTFGRQHIADYTPEEFEESLKRAFVTYKADYVYLDSSMTGQRFRAAGVAWAVDKGWMRHDTTRDEGQSEIYTFRLTDEGKTHFSGSGT